MRLNFKVKQASALGEDNMGDARSLLDGRHPAPQAVRIDDGADSGPS
jgi:hypothetical protein